MQWRTILIRSREAVLFLGTGQPFISTVMKSSVCFSARIDYTSLFFHPWVCWFNLTFCLVQGFSYAPLGDSFFQLSTIFYLYCRISGFFTGMGYRQQNIYSLNCKNIYWLHQRVCNLFHTPLAMEGITLFSFFVMDRGYACFQSNTPLNISRETLNQLNLGVI